jgi:zinc protease
MSKAAVRPGPGAPRDWRFPRAVEHVTRAGMRVILLPMPSRPIASIQMLFGGGAAGERPEESGLSALLARLLTEGTEHHDADGLIEAGELLGASIGAESGWESLTVGAGAPVSRLAGVFDLMAEIALTPRIPEADVERLKALRLAAIKQAHASPRSRAVDALSAALYAPEAAYSRPFAGTADGVARLTREQIVARHQEILRTGTPTLVLAGDIDPDAAFALIEASRLSEISAGGGTCRGEPDRAAPVLATPGAAPLVNVLDRPGSVQSEIRIGRIGRSRLDANHHAALVYAEIIGGLFGSRLNRVLREEKGYTYGAGARFDLRRGRGPFMAGTAVETGVTAPALAEARRQLATMQSAPPTDEELTEARDYLCGTFPLRFGTATPVASMAAALTVLGLSLNEPDHFRERVAAVDRAAIALIADELAASAEKIVIVGDAAAITGPLEAEGFTVQVEADSAASA